MDYSYLILDADATTALQLEHFLEDHAEFDCLGTPANSSDGMNAILKHMPDLVIVNLGEKAYEFMHMVTELHQYVKELPVFVGIARTKQYAYDAIKHNFFDYWLLPFNELDIRKTILRIKKSMPKEDVSQILCLKSYKDFQYLDTDEILYLKADNNTTDLIMKDGSVISAFKTLKSFESRLPSNFIRIHQSYILNTKYVSRINYGKSNCTLKLVNTQLPFSRTYRQNVDVLKGLLSKNSINFQK